MKPAAQKEAPLTLSQLVRFYHETIEPRFVNLESEIQGIHRKIKDLQAQILDLYKKYEDLHMEYLVITEQLKRIEARLDERDEVPKLKLEVALLQRRVEELERSRSSHQ